MILEGIYYTFYIQFGISFDGKLVNSNGHYQTVRPPPTSYQSPPLIATHSLPTQNNAPSTHNNPHSLKIMPY